MKFRSESIWTDVKNASIDLLCSGLIISQIVNPSFKSNANTIDDILSSKINIQIKVSEDIYGFYKGFYSEYKNENIATELTRAKAKNPKIDINQIYRDFYDEFKNENIAMALTCAKAENSELNVSQMYRTFYAEYQNENIAIALTSTGSNYATKITLKK